MEAKVTKQETKPMPKQTQVIEIDDIDDFDD